MRPLDPTKVKKFLDKLNLEDSESPLRNKAGSPMWVEMSEMHALTRLEIKDDGTVMFIPTSGFPVKGFVNTSTGEVSLFTARLFQKDE